MRRSAGVLLYRQTDDGVEVMLVHMGGPFWARKDEHAWSIPKGEYGPGSDTAEDDPRVVAAREFAEELGSPLPEGPELELGTISQSGKTVTGFARAADFDASTCTSNTFELEWPPKSGRMQTFPEVDRAEWFDVETARRKVVKGQIALIDRLLDALRDKS